MYVCDYLPPVEDPFELFGELIYSLCLQYISPRGYYCEEIFLFLIIFYFILKK